MINQDVALTISTQSGTSPGNMFEDTTAKTAEGDFAPQNSWQESAQAIRFYGNRWQAKLIREVRDLATELCSFIDMLAPIGIVHEVANVMKPIAAPVIDEHRSYDASITTVWRTESRIPPPCHGNHPAVTDLQDGMSVARPYDDIFFIALQIFGIQSDIIIFRWPKHHLALKLGGACLALQIFNTVLWESLRPAAFSMFVQDGNDQPLKTVEKDFRVSIGFRLRID